MEVSVCFGSCTLPLDGGECLYLKQKINSSLKSDHVISILPSVNGEFNVGWEPLGSSRSLKITFTSRQSVDRVRRWLSKNKITRGDTDMMLTLDSSVSHLKIIPEVSKISQESYRFDVIQSPHRCEANHPLTEHQPDHSAPDRRTVERSIQPSRATVFSKVASSNKCSSAIHCRMCENAGCCMAHNHTMDLKRCASQSPGRLHYRQSRLAPPPSLDRDDDAEWAAELARVRQRLDSVAALHRLRR